MKELEAMIEQMSGKVKSLLCPYRLRDRGAQRPARGDHGDVQKCHGRDDRLTLDGGGTT